LQHPLTEKQANFDCPLCHADLKYARSSLSGHLARHMEEIALSVLSPEIEESDAGSETASVCSGARSSEDQSNKNIIRCVCGRGESEPHDMPLVRCFGCRVSHHAGCVGELAKSTRYYCEHCRLNHDLVYPLLRPQQSIRVGNSAAKLE
jgi:hypothetical protein